MELGGNLPESLIPFTILGHDGGNDQNVGKSLGIPEKVDKNE
jgi:hypothetical protein